MVDANDSKSFGEIHASSTLAPGTKQLAFVPYDDMGLFVCPFLSFDKKRSF